MALFGKKKAAAEAARSDDEAEDKPAAPEKEVEDESSVELKKEALAAKPSAGGGILGLVVSGAVITLIAAGGGVALGMKTNAAIEKIIADRDAAAKPAENAPLTLKYSGDTVVRQIEPVITNLAAPADTWIRLEMAMIFKNGAVANPEVTSAELRQDAVAYLRTISLPQLEGPSALQHLREDLNERASLRTGGQVSELVIQTLVVQ